MVHILTGIGLAALGYLVKYRKWTWLIAGYNISSREEKARYDTTALCAGVGNFLFMLAGAMFLASLGELRDWDRLILAGWILFGVMSAAFLIYANTGNRFRK